jgi:pimeloyl-ACP methyl ester carboxylesterase
MAPPGRIVDGPHANPVAFDVTDSGPIAVLVHGITENRTFWDDATAGLGEHRTVVRVDLPGHGESGPGIDYSLTESAGAVFAVAFAVTGELGLSEPPDLVGHSLGGTVVSAYAAAFATRSVVNVHQPLELSDSQAVLQAIEPALQGDTSSLPRSSPCSRG